MGKEVQRRRDLIAATIREIGETGTLSVTVGKIAKRAGVSPGLAFHYFGDKEALFLAAMRAILGEFHAEFGGDAAKALDSGAKGSGKSFALSPRLRSTALFMAIAAAPPLFAAALAATT